jgi:hypothetical protein
MSSETKKIVKNFFSSRFSLLTTNNLNTLKDATKNSGYITGHQNSGRGKYFRNE